MILTVNVSNSNILLGAYQDDKQCFCSSMHTNLLKSADEYAVWVRLVSLWCAAGGYFRRHSFLRCALYAGLCPQGAEPPLHGTHLCRRAGPQNRAFHPDR